LPISLLYRLCRLMAATLEAAFNVALTRIGLTAESIADISKLGDLDGEPDRYGQG